MTHRKSFFPQVTIKNVLRCPAWKFADLGSDTTFNGMFCDARELADEIDIPANVELTQPRHTVRRRNVNFDYEARDDPIEDPTLKYKAKFIFSH
ncbi:uncharacterized protein TNCV_1364451 [Trichonephila clavipes]|uniref:Uncharacterized protein n=1 Tax=Trichonephila clavipes TaxID=2585209 RepID=A0A8X6VCF6_TRICX|nr:uncharacterized protein TNCV_1364451 [Trichonephila clavipes]